MQPFDGNDPRQPNNQNDSDYFQNGVIDPNYVYYAGEMSEDVRRRPSVPILPIIIVALTVIAAAVAVFIVFMPRNNASSVAPATTAPTEAPLSTVMVQETTQATPETSQAVTQETTQATSAATTAATEPTQSEEEKLMTYARESGLFETLQAKADTNMTIVVSAEKNILIVRYLVTGNSQDETQAEYFNSVVTYFNDVSTQLDGPVYEMKTNSGVSDAVLQLEVVDGNSVLLYSNVVD